MTVAGVEDDEEPAPGVLPPILNGSSLNLAWGGRIIPLTWRAGEGGAVKTAVSAKAPRRR